MPPLRYTRLYEKTEFPIPDNYFENYQDRLAASKQEMNVYRDAQQGYDLKMTCAVGSTEWRKDIWPHLLARLTQEQREEWVDMLLIHERKPTLQELFAKEEG